tara:strand:+ start:1200 stop:1475 length:276 start_codon:yes stop_codon:yes gene_type:complete
MAENSNKKPLSTDSIDLGLDSNASSATHAHSKEESWRIAFDQLKKKLGIIRTRIEGVWDRVYPGFYLYGPAGTGKTYNVLETLDRIRECRT